MFKKFRYPIVGTIVAGLLLSVFQNFYQHANVPTTFPPPPPPVVPIQVPHYYPSTFQISGAGGSTPTQTIIYKDLSPSTGKVRILVTAEPAPPVPNSNVISPYGCMSVRVGVNGVTKSTPLIRVANIPQNVDSPCVSSPSSAELVFDVNPNTTSQVTVSNGYYDNCRLNTAKYGFSGYQYVGCTPSLVWKNHLIKGVLSFISTLNDSQIQATPNFDISGAEGYTPKQIFSVTALTGYNPYQPASNPNDPMPLRLRVRALPSAAPSSPYGQSISSYGCMSVNVTINGQKINSGLMSVPGNTQGGYSPCANAPSFKELEFVGQFVKSGAEISNIQVSEAWYDNCKSPAASPFGCAISQVSKDHRVWGRIEAANHP